MGVLSAKKKAARKSRLKLKKFTRVRDELALQYRHKMDWTRNAFKAIGDDAQSEDDEDEESDELVVLSPDDRPDKINATGLSEVMQSHLNYVPTEAIVGLSVAAALLFILVLVRSCVRCRPTFRVYTISTFAIFQYFQFCLHCMLYASHLCACHALV